MTEFQHGPDGQPTGESAEPIARQPVSPPTGLPLGHVPPSAERWQQVSGYARPGRGFGSSAAPASGGRTGLIILGVLGLAATLAVGVVIGLSVNGGDSRSAAPPSSNSATSPAAPATTTRREPAPGNYTMTRVTDACALVDGTRLHKWSSTPKEPPQHREYPPDDYDGGNLSCSIRYISDSTIPGDATVDEAGIGLQAEFTGATSDPAYDDWKQTDTAPGSGRASGDPAGIGARAYWHTATSPTGNAMTYIVGVQDSNVSVRVEVAVLRAPGEGPVSRDELGALAEDQARQTLDGLRN
ncbi:hypothetical protein [Nocardia sp. N2S4-5]|uniref:hypothetical protein n=1 Tax=Nocardia sp. N2S4-5 TaxID=3351565 RepID=UPI0037D7FB83